MKKILGIAGLFAAVFLLTAVLAPKSFLLPYNLENLTERTALFGIISIGVAFVIITGGIDLSIGSVIGLVGVILPLLLVRLVAVLTPLYDKLDPFLPSWAVKFGVNAQVAAILLSLAAVMLLSLAIGLAHGLLITKLRLQPFVVTLCGLLVYRGLARWITGDQTQGFGNQYDGLRWIATGKIPLPFLTEFKLPVTFLILAVVTAVAAVFLNKTIYGRYLLALGRNEQAARYSGINTDRMVIVAYCICSFLAGIGGILFALNLNSVQPSGHGNFYELYAIAAAVLGGCSLRGGEGTILGVVIGQAVLRVLYNSITLLGIPTELEFAIIGAVILAGVITDEVVKRLAARRRAAVQARELARGQPKTGTK